MTETELRDKLTEADRLRQRADEIEREALLIALEQSQGLLGRAAKLLGVDRQLVTDWTRRKHRMLAPIAREMRARAGYRGGNPNLYTTLQESTRK